LLARQTPQGRRRDVSADVAHDGIMQVPEQVVVLAEQIRAALSAKGREGRVVVLIDGPAGAGKTSVARWLAWQLPGRAVATVHMDDLYDGWGGLDDGLTNYLADEVVPQLRDGGPLVHRMYDWAAGAFAADAVVPESPVLVIEGVGSGQPVMAAESDFAVWVEASADVCAKRWEARDGAQMIQHRDQWFAAQDAHFAHHRTRQRADMVIAT
jgi:uridine kinase